MQRATPVSSSVPPSNIPQPTGLSGLISRIWSATSYRWLLWTPLAIGAGKLFGASAACFLFGLLIAVEVYLNGRSASAAANSVPHTQSVVVNQVVIGSPQKPVSYDELRSKLTQKAEELRDKTTDTLVIYADNYRMNTDPGIMALQPMKLILVGARVVHGISTGGVGLDKALSNSPEWESFYFFQQPHGTLTKIYAANSVEAALRMKSPLKPNASERYHMVIQVPAKKLEPEDLIFLHQTLQKASGKDDASTRHLLLEDLQSRPSVMDALISYGDRILIRPSLETILAEIRAGFPKDAN